MAEEKKPVGDSIRDLVNAAMEDERRHQVQLDLLDESFKRIASQIPRVMQQELTQVFNMLSRQPQEERNLILIEMLTTGQYHPVKQLQIQIETSYTQFSVEDIKALPGYIKMHEEARAANIAINLVGLTTEDSRGGPALLVFDGTKSYEDGAAEHSMLYPDLPPPPRKDFKGSGPKSFDL